MRSFLTTMRVTLGVNHLRPERTRHAIGDANGEREFPPFVRLEIAKYPGDDGYYLLHVCEDGSMADTHHSTAEEAVHPAEWEFGVQRSEWQVVQPSGSVPGEAER
jgi:hypothetical protein